MGQNSVVFWPNVVLIGSFACRARINWCLAKFIEDMIEVMHFAVDQFFFSYSIFLDDKILTQIVIYYKSRCPHNAVWNTKYYKLRCNSTQFVMYYKLRYYYKLQRNNAPNGGQLQVACRDPLDVSRMYNTTSWQVFHVAVPCENEAASYFYNNFINNLYGSLLIVVRI